MWNISEQTVASVALACSGNLCSVGKGKDGKSKGKGKDGKGKGKGQGGMQVRAQIRAQIRACLVQHVFSMFLSRFLCMCYMLLEARREA